jgi:hypothetical protein
MSRVLVNRSRGSPILLEWWKPVVGFEGHYEVSDVGRVRSLKHRWGPRIPPKELQLRLRADGHMDVRLCLRGVQSRPLVHRLVLEAFVGPCPKGQEARHKNDQGNCNWLFNLCWGTRTENLLDRTRNGGTNIRGENNPNYKHGRDAGRNRREYMRRWRSQRTVVSRG